jgi:hypothetical protein
MSKPPPPVDRSTWAMGIRTDLASRLIGSCPHLTPVEFDALLDSMLAVRLADHGREARNVAPFDVDRAIRAPESVLASGGANRLAELSLVLAPGIRRRCRGMTEQVLVEMIDNAALLAHREELRLAR